MLGEHKAVAIAAGIIGVTYMSRVQNIKAAIGETDLEAPRLPALDFLKRFIPVANLGHAGAVKGGAVARGVVAMCDRIAAAYR